MNIKKQISLVTIAACWLCLSFLAGCRHRVSTDTTETITDTARVEVTAPDPSIAVPSDSIPLKEDAVGEDSPNNAKIDEETAEAKVNAKDKTEAAAKADDEAQKKQNQQVQKFKQLYNGLGNLNQITPGTVGKVRTAYNSLPTDEKKPEYDRRIQAYEALVSATDAKKIQDILMRYPNAFSAKQKNALKKLSSDISYHQCLQQKGYIDINYINKTIN